jgi:N-acetylmuramoyl-L-alanine amidase
VKQAPFVVLMGLSMPASLVEIGFVSNRQEAQSLASDAQRDQIADALSRAVLEFGRRYDARRGIHPSPITSTGGG